MHRVAAGHWVGSLIGFAALLEQLSKSLLLQAVFEMRYTPWLLHLHLTETALSEGPLRHSMVAEERHVQGRGSQKVDCLEALVQVDLARGHYYHDRDLVRAELGALAE